MERQKERKRSQGEKEGDREEEDWLLPAVGTLPAATRMIKVLRLQNF